MTQTGRSGKAVAPMSGAITLAEKNIGSRVMNVWRVVGWILFLAGLSGLARDVIAWFDTKVWAPIAIGQLWYEFDRSSLNLAQAVIQRYVSPFLWDRVVVSILVCWASAVLSGLGALILLLSAGRRKART
jgi:hypothetical protein